MIYLELFWSFFQIGLMSIGGGYAAIPLIQQQAVDIHAWLTVEEFANLITIAEMTPGPIAINSATFVGNQTAGILGGVIATIGCIFAPCIIVLTLALLFKRYKNLNAVQGVLSGLRPAVVALIASAGVAILILALWGGVVTKDINIVQAVIFILGLLIMRKFKKLNPIIIMVGAGIIGVAVYFIGNII